VENPDARHWDEMARQLSRRFQADDETGTAYDIEEWTYFVPATSQDQAAVASGGLKE
jgi:hypothetical protein